jgi:DNA-binding beta-propeller fold protein YncE
LLDANGDIYISDGYRNCRVHKFSPDGKLLFSWGEPGENDAQFRNVHSVWQHKGKVYVADRQNNRLQVFTPDGKHIETWPGYVHPTKIFVDQNDVMYVAELDARVRINDPGNARPLGRRAQQGPVNAGPHG